MIGIEMSDDKLIFAADSGGSRIRAVLLHYDGHPLVTATGPGVASIPGTLPVEKTIRETVSRLIEKGGRAGVEIGTGYFSLGGPNSEEVELALARVLPASRIKVDREAKGNWFKACAPMLGVDACVMAGTGTVAMGLDGDAVICSGGWGPLFDDAGSGYSIGLAGLRKALLMLDRREAPTRLIEILKPYGNMPAQDDFAGRMAFRDRFLQLGRAEIAAVSPVVYRLFLEGDPAAAEIICEAAVAVARLAVSVAGKPDAKVLLMGGISAQAETFLPLCSKHLKALRPDMEILCRPEFSLFKAAVVMALLDAGAKPDFQNVLRTEYEWI